MSTPCRTWGLAALLMTALLTTAPGQAQEPMPTIMELMTMTASERDPALARFCREAGPREWDTCLELATQPALAGRHLGALGIAMRRAAAAATDEQLQALRDSPSPATRWLARRVQGLAPLSPATQPPGQAAVFSENLTPEQLVDLDLLYLPATSRLLTEPDLRQRLRDWWRGERTLYILGSPGGLPDGTRELLSEYELPPPRVEQSNTTFIANLAQPHPIHDNVYLLAPLIMHQPLPDSEAAEAAQALAPYVRPGKAALSGWNPAIWRAPFIGIQAPGEACLLEAPANADRGRLILDVSGSQLEPPGDVFNLGAGCLAAYEIGANLRAYLLGYEAVPPHKTFYNSAGDIDFTMPHPYLDLSDAVKPMDPPLPLRLPAQSVVFCLPDIMARAAIELDLRRQPRLTARYLPFSQHGVGPPHDKTRLRPPILDGGAVIALRQASLGPDDVLVLPAFADYALRRHHELSWKEIPAEIQADLIRQVRLGLGLVFLGPDFSPTWLADADLTPLEPPDELLAALPIPREQAAALIACYQLAEGRLIHLKIPMINGTAPLALDDGFIVPGLVSPHTMRVNVHRFGFRLGALALHWVRQRPAPALPEETIYMDRFGFLQPTEPPGPAIRLRGHEATRVGPPTATRPEVTFASRVIAPGAPLRISLDAPEGEARLQAQVEVLDRLGQPLRRQQLALTAPRTEVVLAGWTPHARWHDLRVAISRGDTLVADGVIPFAVDLQRHPDDLRWWVTPGPTPFLPGLLAAGITGINSQREHPLPYLDRQTDPRYDTAFRFNHWDHALRAGLDLYQLGGIGPSIQVNDPSGTGKMPVSFADPALWGGIRRNIASQAAAWSRLGIRDFNIDDEFHLPPTLDFGPLTLHAFRRQLRLRYGDLNALNTAWERSFTSWAEVRPDTLEQAITRGNLVSWTQHRAFMEALVVRFRDETERLLREYIPAASVDMGNNIEGPDTGIDLAEHLRAAGWHTQYDGRDTIRKRDLRRPDTDLGLWLPFNLGRNLRIEETYEARFIPHQYLMEGYRDSLTWWGFEDFGWPFLRPDFTLCQQFQAMSETFAHLSGGLDRLILGAAPQRQRVAAVFSHPSYRTVHALHTATDDRLVLWHEWEFAAELLGPRRIRGHVIRPDAMAQLDPTQTPLLVLFGVVALTDGQLAALQSYVQRGGSVVADILPGAFTEEGARRDQRAIAALFGVSGQQNWPPTAAPSQPVTLRGPFAGIGSATASPCLPDLALAGGTAHGASGAAPILISHQLGEGQTLLLNLAPRQWLNLSGRPGMALPNPRSDTEHEARLAFAGAIAQWVGLTPVVDVLSEAKAPRYPGPDDVHIYQDGKALVVGILNASYAPVAEARLVTLRTAEPHFLYDLQAPVPPTAADAHQVSVPARRAGYYVLTPSPLPAITAELQTIGEHHWRLTVSAGPQRRIVRLGVADPDGQVHRELGRELTFTGQGVLPLSLPLDATPGAWRLTLTEIITGQTLPITLEVSP